MKPIKNIAHMERVAELPCVVCESDQVQVHHIRDSGITGLGKRASDWLTFSLCGVCHANLHSGIKSWEMAHGAQITHVVETLDRLYG